jgi:NADH-quinone oxidoreductase subunit E
VNDTWTLRDHIKSKLGIGHGETTEDGLFTFEEVECLNACDRAPVMQVGDRYEGPLDIASLDALIDRLRTTKESTVVQYANTVVNVHLQTSERQEASY